MLSDERIKQLACVYMEGDVDRECERAIRLAVAETVEACAVVCDNLSDDAMKLPAEDGESVCIKRAMAHILGAAARGIRAAAIREKAREKK